MVRAPDVIDAPERDAGPGVPSDPAEGDAGGDSGHGGSSRPAPTRRRDGYDRLEYWIGLAILATCVVYVFIQLGPSLVLRNTTITGGDTGAHVWFPDFLIDHFLPWRVAGWSNDFYAGFPAGQFYFPFPAVLIALLDVFIPYNIAFKVVTALGPLLLPAGAYVFARGIRAPRPAAPMLALAATGFLFFKDGGDATMTFDFHIMGGNLPSTLAGEYSFMIALALSLFFLGTFARALDRRGRALAASGAAGTHHPQPRRGRDLRGVRGRRDLVDHPPGQELHPSGRGRRGRCPADRVLVRAARGEPRQHHRHAVRADRQLPRLDVHLGELVPLPAGAGRARGGDLVPPAGDADRGGHHRRHRPRLLELGGSARDLRQGAGVEPPAAAVLVSSCCTCSPASGSPSSCASSRSASPGSSGATAVRCGPARRRRDVPRSRRSTRDRGRVRTTGPVRRSACPATASASSRWPCSPPSSRPSVS